MNELQERIRRAGDGLDVDTERQLDRLHRAAGRRSGGRRVAAIAVATAVAVIAALVVWQLRPVGRGAEVPGAGDLHGTIAYTQVTGTSQQDGDIELVDAGSGSVTQLGAGSHDDNLPAWSPDGSQVAFLSDEGTTPGSFQLYAMNADGSDRRRLATGAFSALSWSPDGTAIAVVAGDRGVSVIPTNGMTASRDINSELDGNWTNVSWSPDGSRLLVSGFPSSGANAGAYDLYTMTPQGGDLVQLTHDELYEAFASWSPDGSKILYMRNHGSDDFDPRSDICVMNADGSDPVQLTDWQGFDGEPVWSTDGRWIAFSSDRAAPPAQQQAIADGDGAFGISLFTMDATGGDVRLLVEAEADASLFASSWTG